MKTNLRRIRPESKRKAISAQAFVDRYIREAWEAGERKDFDLARKLNAKASYWNDRLRRLTANG